MCGSSQTPRWRTAFVTPSGPPVAWRLSWSTTTIGNTSDRAWAIVAVLALVFGSIELMWPSRSAPLGLVTADVDAAFRARRAFDPEQRDDIEPLHDGSSIGDYEDAVDARQIALDR